MHPLKTFRRADGSSFELRWQDIANLYFYIAVFIILIKTIPNSLWDANTHTGFLVIGIIGTWRWGWWIINFIRSVYYGFYMFPRMRANANESWRNGWRPRHIHYLATTFHEKEATTHKFLESIAREIRDSGIPGTLWFGVGAKYDEKVIEAWVDSTPNVPMEIIFVKQNQPGKRAAIGLLLRALSRHGVSNDDLVFMMDGDSIMAEGSVRKCSAIMMAYPEYTALTTNEDVVCVGPEWAHKWLRMRFAQRRMWMQSHAVSHKVLTLTGRMSVFRAMPITEKEFIRTMEADHLGHWFWGPFRFLSGDDKSTWYSLLKKGYNMTYLPDVMVYTIEYIEGNGIKRARDNLLRWSGNMLRNGMRAIALGPRKVGFFIWWCLIDQRVSIWTFLIGLFTALSIGLFINHQFLYSYLLWVMFTRGLVGCTLFMYADRIRVSFMPMLYINQIITSFIKVYIMFRLPMQSWTNRMGQKASNEMLTKPFMRYFATYMNFFALITLTFFVLVFAGILKIPDILQVI